MRLLSLLLLASVSALAQGDFAGEWAVTVYDEFGGPNSTRLVLKQDGEKIAGSVGGQAIEGTAKGAELSFKAGNRTVKASLVNGALEGEITQGDRTSKLKAVRLKGRQQPRTHTFEPTQFELYFTSTVKPVLHIAPGDTVKTWSVDAGGTDPAGKRRSPGGNPQTGPFYVEGALPGDTLVVRLDRVRTNRDWAGSGNRVMSNALEPGSNPNWTPSVNGRWKIDAQKGVAYLEKPTDKLKTFEVPLRPMLGCIAVAPQGQSSIRTTDSGRFGGNMDYNQIVEGTTLYLPVYHPGALLFVGDGHAAQGDGELTGDALETSMDIEFTVDVIPGRQFGHPLAENSEYRISIGIGGSLDQALQMATSGMMRWLDRDYKLTASEAAMVMGFAVRYDVVDLVGTQVSIAAKLPKTALAKLVSPVP